MSPRTIIHGALSPKLTGPVSTRALRTYPTTLTVSAENMDFENNAKLTIRCLRPRVPTYTDPLIIECQADYMLKLVDRWQRSNIHSFAPKLEAVEDFIAHKDQFMSKTVWDEECRS